jgi:L-lysine 2,3-aminomutase
MSHPTALRPVLLDSDWRAQLRNVISDGATLLAELGLTPEQVGFSEAACRAFSLRVPRAFLRRMRPGDPQDPLLRQVLATGEELASPAGFGTDPTGEHAGAIPRAGIIHKYRGRLLLVVTGGCAINCRYCFRRHFPYSDNVNSRRQWAEALEYVAQERSISEVILSGGDPLVADDPYLAELVGRVAAIGHVRRLRVHSRLPIVLPDRITPALLDALAPAGLQSVLVVHANHANEIDHEVGRAFARVRERGITLLNQSVLLAGVNDSVPALVALSEALFAHGALPYYLHLLDKVRGAAHFDLPEARAQALHAGMQRELPGYLVPRLVREIAGEPAKTPIPPLSRNALGAP